MIPEAQRIAIAIAVGWKKRTVPSWDGRFRWDGPLKHQTDTTPPDYLNDLNAMHEAERMLTTENAFKYSLTLGEVCMIPRSFPNSTNWHYYWRQLHATAAERAEAFLKTLNLWTE